MLQMLNLSILFEKLRFKNCWPVHTKAQSRRFQIPPVQLKSVFEKLRFCDGLVWTVGLTVEIKLRFHLFFRRSVDFSLDSTFQGHLLAAWLM